MRKFMNAIGLWFFAATTLMAQNQDYSKVEIKVTKVAGTVYMLQGAGGNIGVSAGDDGIVIRLELEQRLQHARYVLQ